MPQPSSGTTNAHGTAPVPPPDSPQAPASSALALDPLEQAHSPCAPEEQAQSNEPAARKGAASSNEPVLEPEFAPNAHGQGRLGRMTRVERAYQTLGLEPTTPAPSDTEPATVPAAWGTSAVASAATSKATSGANNASLSQGMLPKNSGNGILAQYAAGRPSALPGFALVFIQKQAIFLDEWAVRLLDLDPHLAQTWVDVKALLRTLGPDIKRQAFFYTKQLRDNQKCLSKVRELNLPCPYGLTAASCFKLHSIELPRPLHSPEAQAAIDAAIDAAINVTPEAAPEAPARAAEGTAQAAEGATQAAEGTVQAASLQRRALEPKCADLQPQLKTCPKGGFCCRMHPEHHAAYHAAQQLTRDNIEFKSVTAALAQVASQSTVEPEVSYAHVLGDQRGNELRMRGAPELGPSALPQRQHAHSELNIEPHSDRSSFYIILRHGAYAGTKLYVHFNGFFESGRLSHIMVAFSRVASNLFELVPHMVTESASFDWIVPTDDCVYGRNYFTMLGYSFKGSELPHKKQLWEQCVVHPDDLATVHKSSEVLASAAHGNSYELLYRSRCHNQSYIWTKYIGRVLGRNSCGHATRVLGINIDINRVLAGYEQLQSRVFTDILTGLKNRIYLITHLDEFIYEAHDPLTIIFADVTALKVYNDYLGHAIGDKLLCSAALLLQDNIDRNRELIRISGDEIVCLLPNCDEAEAKMLEHKLLRALHQYNSNAPIRMPVFFSLGTQTLDLSAYAGRKLNQAEKDLAQELFYQALQEADAIMRQNKRLAHQEHYTLVQTYIEQQLKQPISLHDRRLF